VKTPSFVIMWWLCKKTLSGDLVVTRMPGFKKAPPLQNQVAHVENSGHLHQIVFLSYVS